MTYTSLAKKNKRKSNKNDSVFKPSKTYVKSDSRWLYRPDMIKSTPVYEVSKAYTDIQLTLTKTEHQELGFMYQFFAETFLLSSGQGVLWEKLLSKLIIHTLHN
jgi:hypothetical protein